MDSARKSFFLISFIALLFGWWFATQQVIAIAPTAFQSYPWIFFSLTVFKCYFSILNFFLFSALLLSFISINKIPLVAIACTFLPLLGVFFINPFTWIMLTTLCLQLLLLISFLHISDYKRLSHSFLFNFLILLAFFVLHYQLTTRFSPSHWNMVLFTANGATSEEAYVLAPIYKGFILAKQFAFDYIDHSQWAGIMNTPVALTSPLMQLTTFSLDLPSLDITSFHKVLSAINFSLIVLGSFGSYLFLRYAAKINILFALFGGFLYFFSGDPHIERMFTSDAGIFLSSYAVFPYALLLITLAFRKQSILLSLWAAVALASQFFFLYPHPEAVIYSFCFFGLYTLGLYFFTINIPVILKRKLIFYTILALLCLSAFIFVPIVYDRLSHQMYVFAHTGDIHTSDWMDFQHYIFLMLLAVVANFIFSRPKTKSVVFKASLTLTAAIFVLSLLSMNKFALKLMAQKLHVGLHLWFTWRYSMYFCFMTSVMCMYALDGITNQILIFISNTSIRKMASFVLPILLIIFSVSLFPLHVLRSNEAADNAPSCPYYISLQSLLTNYKAMPQDTANALFIKNKLLKFEKDLERMNANPHVAHYTKTYTNILTSFKLKSATSANTETALKIAQLAFNNIDDFYLNEQLFCRNSLYNWENSQSRRVLHFNFGGYFDQLPNRFVRIQSFLSSGAHLGVFPGFIVNNQTTALGTQFMTGLPLLTALYVLPGHNYEHVGSYIDPVPWCAFWSGYVTDPKLRKIMDIAGIDIFVISKKDLDERIKRKEIKGIAGVTPIKSGIRKEFIENTAEIYSNNHSYGLVYLANNIQYLPLDAIKKEEQAINKYFAHPMKHQPFHFMQARDQLYQRLLALKNKHDVIVESARHPAGMQSNLEPAGNVKILGMVGARILASANCQREACTVVFNIGDSPGWHAIVNGNHSKIERANFAFMATTIPHGQSLIWLIYEPLSQLISYLISIITLLVILTLTLLSIKKGAYDV